MRTINQITCLVLTLLIFLFPHVPPVSDITSESSIVDEIGQNVMHSLSQDNSDLNLTWTSLWESTPQTVMNNSQLVGDHVMLNATWNDQLFGGNVTKTTLKMTDGFIFNTTRALIPGGSPIQWDYNLYDWVEIRGLTRGDSVSITGYAESDCDYIAIDGDLPIEDWDFSEDLLGFQMFTLSNPERGNFTWDSDSDTMYLGCENYEDVVGNYTIVVKVGDFHTSSTLGNNILLDTYWLDSRNETYTLSVIAETDLNETYSFMYTDIEICNFFAPIFTSGHVYEYPEDFRTLNISWSTYDNNSGDTTYNEVWLSKNDGVSYMLLEGNFTQPWVVWNSTGWLEGRYLVRIRAFSVDYSSSECDLDNPPWSYWPGDYTDIFTFVLGGGPHSLPPGYFTLDMELDADSSHYLDSIGNILTITLTFHYSLPSFSVEYTIEDNGSTWIQGDHRLSAYTTYLEINLDELAIGHHILEVKILDYSQVCTIDVLAPSTTGSTTPDISGILFSALTLGISIGSISVIAIVIVLSIRLKRNQIVGYANLEQTVLELD